MKKTSFSKVAVTLVMAGMMFVLAGNASAQTVTRSYVYSYGSGGFDRSSHLEQQRRMQQQRMQQQRSLQRQQAPVINIYNQPRQSYSYTRPQYNNNYYRQPPAYNSSIYRAPRREVIVVERQHKPMSTKDVAKTAGVLVGLHCIFTGCL